MKSVHPTNPTRVCDNCYDILTGALAVAGQLTGRALGTFVFDEDDDNDDESDFERLKLSSEVLQENLMKSAAGEFERRLWSSLFVLSERTVMVQRLALTMNNTQPHTSPVMTDDSTPRTSEYEDERNVIIGRKSTVDIDEGSTSESESSTG